MEKIKNILFLPVRFIFSHDQLDKWGLRSLKDERYDMAFKYCRGRLLDIGCGDNKLVKTYGNGVGVDVYDFGGGADGMIVKDTSDLPFKDEEFDTVTLVAVLDHIPEPSGTIKEVHRLLKPGGRVIITNLGPFLAKMRHVLTWWDKDEYANKLTKIKTAGISPEKIMNLMKNFRFVKRKKFVIGLNNLYIFEKKS